MRIPWRRIIINPKGALHWGIPTERLTAMTKCPSSAAMAESQERAQADNDAALTALRAQYPWPDVCPDLAPIDWTLAGGGGHLVLENIEKHGVRVIVEIGVYLGGSVKKWLEASPEIVVVAVDPWEWASGDFARQAGRPESEARQLDDPAAGYRVFMRNLWEDRHRVIPVRGTSPDKLHDLHAAGLRPDMIYIDSDKSGRELEVCEALFPGAIICGDDWLYRSEQGYPIRRPVRTFCRKHGRYLRVARDTWVIDTERPPLRYYLNRALDRDPYRRQWKRVKRAVKEALGLRGKRSP